MPDAEMTALLQAVLDEVCADLPPWDTTTRERVAERLRNLVRSGRSSVDELKRVGGDALIRAPTMWP
ncbi:hypothetical protein [Bradyrhizobium guangzhouense]|uniref:Uncharacterized protein n=1 Tax=Bradyrhizobium guangzhouense TaxID=1325095 RepID=A0AAE5X4E3_9BRAD|nr:hypothetical protein [Bradyrhizobium guangzhouense]QAU48463.1 hypothetical protein XH91_26020 [Bradyrhizobium guangzhouense]RXH07935.1 hypothetical protein EAS56_31105 [Bradyrhizobium guangzhouense]